jgi:hypothetical protein
MLQPILLAIVSDIHAGSTLAVCPPQIILDDGGVYAASKAQQWLWECWNDFWKRADTQRRELGAKLIVVFNGDAVEGDHHRSTQIMSGNPNAQAQAWNEVIKVPLSLKPAHIIVMRGTAAHVGESASAEERIADGLRRDKRPVSGDPATGAASLWHWYADIHGVRLDVTHHGRIGQREHTRASQVVLYAHDVHLSYTKRGEPPPHLAFRGHNHKFADSYDACLPRVVATGAWQLGTSYVHKVAPDSIADIGGALVTIRADSTFTVDKVHYQAKRGGIWHL